MKIGAYQFGVTGDMERNFRAIESGIHQAAKEGVRLLAFPECALTGYPPRDMASASLVDHSQVKAYCQKLQELARAHGMYLVVGMITEGGAKPYNTAAVFSPAGEELVYHKRGLWGWDRDNFCPGDQGGVFEIDGVKVGLRICYEIRFPEYFRELYRQDTRLNIVLFYDATDNDDTQRYELIRSHIRTRATENICQTLSVNTTGPYQSAPTGLYDGSGKPMYELPRGQEGLLVYELEDQSPDFGERGRMEYSDLLLGIQREH